MFSAVALHAQKQYKVGLIGFYNCENLFDTIDGDNDDAEFLPNSSHLYNRNVYNDKLSKLSDVLSLIGTDLSPDGLAMFGVAEVETEGVMLDLINQEKLRGRGYKIVHYDSQDKRGIDVGLVYNPKYFKVIKSEPLFVSLIGDEGKPYFTRDVLYVYGLFDGEPLHVLVNHWPSRRGGEASAPSRAIAAGVGKAKIDSIVKADPNAKFILMGDLNDDPVSPSVAKVLGAKGDPDKVAKGGIYNPWVTFYKNGNGTLAYGDSWNLFDQIMVSQSFLDKTQTGFFFQKAAIFKKEFMLQQTGQYKGYPLRTYDGNVYNHGYSDHFPTYIEFLKEKK